jgi:hypothetical protein
MFETNVELPLDSSLQDSIQFAEVPCIKIRTRLRESSLALLPNTIQSAP